MFKQSTPQFHRSVVITAMSHGKHGLSFEANVLQRIVRYKLPNLLESVDEWWTFATLNILIANIQGLPPLQFINDNHLYEVVEELNLGRSPARIECREGQNVHWFRQSATDRARHAPPSRTGISEHDASVLIGSAAKRHGNNILLSDAVNLLWSNGADRTKFNESSLHRHMFNWSGGRMTAKADAEGLIHLWYIGRRDRHAQAEARHSARPGDRDVSRYTSTSSSSVPMPIGTDELVTLPEVSNDDYVIPQL